MDKVACPTEKIF